MAGSAAGLSVGIAGVAAVLPGAGAIDVSTVRPKRAGASRESVHEAVKIAAVVNSVSMTLEAEDSLA